MEGEYWGPSDEKQFLSMEATHILYSILRPSCENPLFRSPVVCGAAGHGTQNILDLGTGNGLRAKELGYLYPSVGDREGRKMWVGERCL